MLPDDAKEHKRAANNKITQSTVTDHFKLKTEGDKPIVYSDKVFTSAAVEWLIDADLVSLFVIFLAYVLIPRCICSHFESSPGRPSKG